MILQMILEFFIWKPWYGRKGCTKVNIGYINYKLVPNEGQTKYSSRGRGEEEVKTDGWFHPGRMNHIIGQYNWNEFHSTLWINQGSTNNKRWEMDRFGSGLSRQWSRDRTQKDSNYTFIFETWFSQQSSSRHQSISFTFITSSIISIPLLL